MPTFDYSVTFEYDLEAPLTHKGRVSGTNGAAARRALDAAQKATAAKRWRSVVVVLERSSAEDGSV